MLSLAIPSSCAIYRKYHSLPPPSFRSVTLPHSTTFLPVILTTRSASRRCLCSWLLDGSPSGTHVYINMLAKRWGLFRHVLPYFALLSQVRTFSLSRRQFPLINNSVIFLCAAIFGIRKTYVPDLRFKTTFISLSACSLPERKLRYLVAAGSFVDAACSSLCYATVSFLYRYFRWMRTAIEQEELEGRGVWNVETRNVC